MTEYITDPLPESHPDDEPRVYADARCVGCEGVTVVSVAASVEPEAGTSLAHHCRACRETTPHNVLKLLAGVNHQREDSVCPS